MRHFFTMIILLVIGLAPCTTFGQADQEFDNGYHVGGQYVGEEAAYDGAEAEARALLFGPTFMLGVMTDTPFWGDEVLTFFDSWIFEDLERGESYVPKRFHAKVTWTLVGHHYKWANYMTVGSGFSTGPGSSQADATEIATANEEEEYNDAVIDFAHHYTDPREFGDFDHEGPAVWDDPDVYETELPKLPDSDYSTWIFRSGRGLMDFDALINEAPDIDGADFDGYSGG